MKRDGRSPGAGMRRLVAPATKNRCLGALRIFLGWAVRVGLIEKLPTVGI